MTPTPQFSIAICTVGRPDKLLRTLDALDAQTAGDFEVVIVDDGEENAQLLERVAADPRLRHIAGPRLNLSRARNIGWQEARAPWVVYLDDDCIPEPDFFEQLVAAIERHPEATVVSGHVGSTRGGSDDHIAVTVAPVREDAVYAGRWVRPWLIGFTLAMAVRREAVERVGGFDERLGPGVRAFPSAEDMDINYRLLRDGAVAYVTPRIRAHHDQWRDAPTLGPHFRGYMAGWSGFSMKYLRSGDVVGGLWHWTAGVQDVLRMFASALRRRSRLRLWIAGCKARGLVAGTIAGARASW